jgi:cell division transport system permease protein
MIRRWAAAASAYLRGTGAADGLVPRVATVDRAAAVLSGVLAFFALLALALGLAAGRLAENWAGPRADVATLQVYAPEAEMEDQARAALNVLRTTPGVESVRMIDLAEQGTLLEPWLGPDIPIESLPLPLMIEITTERSAFNAATLLQRLEAEAPGTVYDDHAGWRQPLVATAERLEMFAFAALALLGVALAAGLVLAATAALAASGAAVATLRLVGARDRFILRAVTRRLVLGAVAGGLVGTIAAALVVALLPRASEQGFFLVGIGLGGSAWLLAAAVPLAVLAISWGATRAAARRGLRRWS